MIHGGGGGTCADLKPLAEDLHRQQNYTIHIPLLPGFGTSPVDLKSTLIETLKKALDHEFFSLRKKVEKVIVGGHSLGGVFTFILASKDKYDIDGIFSISTPIGLKGLGPKLIPLIKPFITYYPVESEKFRNETNGKWVGYDVIPLNIVIKMKKLVKEMKLGLTDVKCPALLFQGCLDSVIKMESMDYIFDRINSPIKKKIWLEQNDHPILDCPNHQEIVSNLQSFINEIRFKQ
jgi:carboxylesterase